VTSSQCVAVAVSNTGYVGVVPITDGTAGVFTPAMARESGQSLTGVACQGAAHCYATGAERVSGKLQGIVYRFALT
jgi:hypothetical protein